MAEACALKRNVSENLTAEVDVGDLAKLSDGNDEAVMPCSTLSYEPVMIWMTGLVTCTGLLLSSLGSLASLTCSLDLVECFNIDAESTRSSRFLLAMFGNLEKRCSELYQRKIYSVEDLMSLELSGTERRATERIC